MFAWWAIWNERTCLEFEPFVKVDLNSAYTSAMVNMKIPYNYPTIIKKEDFNINSEKLQFLHYFSKMGPADRTFSLFLNIVK